MASSAISRALEDPDINEMMLDEEMLELSRLAEEWRAEQRLTQVDFAARIRQFTYRSYERSISSTTVSRWQDPHQIATTRFVSIRALCTAAGRSLRDVSDRMELARMRVLSRVTGVQFEDLADAYIMRREREVRLLSDFRSLPDSFQTVILATVGNMAQANQSTPAENRLDLVPGLEANYQMQVAGDRTGIVRSEDTFQQMLAQLHDSVGNVPDPPARRAGERAGERLDDEKKRDA